MKRKPSNLKPTKFEKLVATHADKLGQNSGYSIERFLELIEMPFLKETQFASELSDLRKKLRVRHGPWVCRPFDKTPVPSIIVDSLAGRLQLANKEWEKKLKKGDIKFRLRYIDFLSPDQKTYLVAEAARSSLPGQSLFQALFKLYDDEFEVLKGVDPYSFGTSVVGYAAYLIEHSSRDRARQLIPLLVASSLEQSKIFIEFLQFLVTERRELEQRELLGVTRFDELSNQDLFLAACYYGEGGLASDSLDQINDWNIDNLRDHLEEHEWRDFLVRGIQPRVAEIAFGRILELSQQGEGALDLNLNEVDNTRLEHPSNRYLPSADWRTAEGEQIDVKSNLFYRSKAKNLGLRGLLINRPRPDRKDMEWAGFVFHASSDDDCSWSYLGKMSWRCLEEELEGTSGDRVAPFLFSLPAELRWTRTVPKDQADEAAKLIKEPKLLMGWCLASSALCETAWNKHKEHGVVAIRFLEDFLKESSELPLEFRLWRSLTRHTITECSEGRYGDVKVLLRLVKQMASSAVDPLRLTRLGAATETILHRWCTEVLEPLRENFPRVACPVCKRRVFSITLSRITGGGAIFGTMACRNACGFGEKEVTILTHCWKCDAYPLVLGANNLCPECAGLICGHENESGQVCGASKNGCTRKSESRLMQNP